MSTGSNSAELESLLARALAPVDPPEHLVSQLEEQLNRISAVAADELDAWEAGAFHDPRTWVRPASALAVGTAAAGAAAVLGLRRRRSRQQDAAAGPVAFAQKAIRTIGNEVTRRFDS